jgi:hypothetical protein
MEYELKTEENLKKMIKAWQKIGISIDAQTLPTALDFTSHDIYFLTKEDIEIMLEVCEALDGLKNYEEQVKEEAYRVYLNIFKS